MNKFLKRLLLFFSLPIIGIVGLLALFHFLYSLSYYTYKTDQEILFIGDSHINQAVNDRLIQNAHNIATNSESYLYTYYKVEYLLKNNPSIKTIYLGSSYHNLSSYYDIYTSGIYGRVISARYFYLLPLKIRISFILQEKRTLLRYIKNILAESSLYFVTQKVPFITGFDNGFRDSKSDTLSMEKRLNFQYSNNPDSAFSSSNISYLKKIVELTTSKGINLYLVSTPLDPYYQERVPNLFLTKFNTLATSLKIAIINPSNEELQLKAADFIPDGDHLSFQGANKFTKWLIANDTTLNSVDLHNNE